MPEYETSERLAIGAINAALILNRNLNRTPTPSTSSKSGEDEELFRIARSMRAYANSFDQVETAFLTANTLIHATPSVMALTYETRIAKPPISVRSYHPKRFGFDY